MITNMTPPPYSSSSQDSWSFHESASAMSQSLFKPILVPWPTVDHFQRMESAMNLAMTSAVAAGVVADNDTRNSRMMQTSCHQEQNQKDRNPKGDDNLMDRGHVTCSVLKLHVSVGDMMMEGSTQSSSSMPHPTNNNKDNQSIVQKFWTMTTSSVFATAATSAAADLDPVTSSFESPVPATYPEPSPTNPHSATPVSFSKYLYESQHHHSTHLSSSSNLSMLEKEEEAVPSSLLPPLSHTDDSPTDRDTHSTILSLHSLNNMPNKTHTSSTDTTSCYTDSNHKKNLFLDAISNYKFSTSQEDEDEVSTSISLTIDAVPSTFPQREYDRNEPSFHALSLLHENDDDDTEEDVLNPYPSKVKKNWRHDHDSYNYTHHDNDNYDNIGYENDLRSEIRSDSIQDTAENHNQEEEEDYDNSRQTLDEDEDEYEGVIRKLDIHSHHQLSESFPNLFSQHIRRRKSHPTTSLSRIPSLQFSHPGSTNISTIIQNAMTSTSAWKGYVKSISSDSSLSLENQKKQTRYVSNAYNMKHSQKELLDRVKQQVQECKRKSI